MDLSRFYRFKWAILVYMQCCNSNNYYFNTFSKNNMKRHINMCLLICLFMFKLYSIIKIEIDISNDELLEIVWESMREIKRCRGNVIKLINLHLHCFYLFFTFSK
jgi:hypothetical protein